MTEHRIKAENVGPVKALDIAVSPGLNVLRGANGSGKSTVLEAVNFALTKTGAKPTPRDGTRAGKLDCFGVQASFTSRATLKGSLEVESLSGRLDLGDLIAPGYESEEVNDARRIKRLIELSGAQATVEMFEPLMPCMILGIPTDLIEAADWTKRQLQEHARDAEQEADRMRLQAAAARKAAEGVDVAVETDIERLNENYVQAYADLARLQQKQSDAEQRKAMAADARKAIARLEHSAVPIPVAEAKLRYETIAAEWEESPRRIAELERALDAAKSRANILPGELRNALAQVQRSEQHEETISAWQAQIASAEGIETVDDMEIEAAYAEQRHARQFIEKGALARNALDKLDDAIDCEEGAKQATTKAVELRTNAAKTDDILAAELQRIGCPWRPVDVPTKTGSVRRLVVDHKRGEQTLVSDLSEGERAKHAIDVALALSGKSDRPAVLILRQEVFEGLQPKVRAEIDAHAKERNVVILTAAASDDEEVTL